MKYVTFNHRSLDSVTLGEEDLGKAGVEGFEEVTFNRGQRVKVTNRVAKALAEDPVFEGLTFDVEDEGEVSDQDVADAKAAEDLAKAEAVQAEAAAAANVTDSGTSQQNITTPKITKTP